MKSKRITADIKGYIKSVVDKEEKVKWATAPHISIPKNMSYPTMRINRITGHSFFSKLLP